MALSTMIGVATLRGAQLLADLGAAHAGQAQVHQHQVGLQGDGLVEALACRRRPAPRESLPAPA